jgi:hypothetical protein
MDLVTPFMNNERPSSGSGGIVEGAVGEDVERIGHEEVCSTEMEIAKGTGNCEGILSFRCRSAFLGKRQGSPQKQRGQRTPPSPNSRRNCAFYWLRTAAVIVFMLWLIMSI